MASIAYLTSSETTPPLQLLKQRYGPRAVLFVCLLLLMVDGSQAKTINWAQFPAWDDDVTFVGIGESIELTVEASFELHSGTFQGGSPNYFDVGVTIAEPGWPYDNLTVPGLTAVTPGGAADYTVSFDFLNAGGLPPGGSLYVGDVESPNTVVEIVGLVDSVPVDVAWQFIPLALEGRNSPIPIWNPTNNTLVGIRNSNAEVNAVFLVSNRPLEQVLFNVSVAVNDGIIFNVAAQPVYLIPEPVTLSGVLIAMAGILCVPLRVGPARRMYPSCDRSSMGQISS